jgi:UDP-glucose 4-epimerase
VNDPGTVLVTGGAGFIGSHTCVELLDHGAEVVVVDDFSNSFPRALERVLKVSSGTLTLYRGDVRDGGLLDTVFESHRIDSVIHFAARKAVRESVDIPLEYYSDNVTGTIELLTAMNRHGVERLVFSSSCSIYGDGGTMPLTEDAPAHPTNPYARSKWMCEQILADACTSYGQLRVIALRYFNPIGAHASGLIGEDPRGVPSNVVPYLTRVAVGRLPFLPVLGTDYPTPDGSCIRDYIHVSDVADGHRIAMSHLDDETGLRVRNLGTGVGTSVLELVAAFEQAIGHEIPVRIQDAKPGDVPELIADPELVAAEWGWRTTRDLDQRCQDAWRFQRANPDGYGE